MARWFAVLVIIAVTAVCGTFLALGVEIPAWFPVVGRWLPAVVTLVVLGVARAPGGLAHWWQLRPGGWRRLLVGAALSVAILFAVHLATAGIVSLAGVAQLIGVAELATVALLVPVFALGYAVSTLGEEVAWRGFLPTALGDRGFWRTSTVIALLWVAFHIPLHGTMALQGTLPWSTAITATLLLLPLGILLSGFVARWRSVWPAVFAHAAPLTALNLLSDPGTLGVGREFVVLAVGSTLMLAVTWFLRRGSGRQRPGDSRQTSLESSSA